MIGFLNWLLYFSYRILFNYNIFLLLWGIGWLVLSSCIRHLFAEQGTYIALADGQT